MKSIVMPLSFIYHECHGLQSSHPDDQVQRREWQMEAEKGCKGRQRSSKARVCARGWEGACQPARKAFGLTVIRPSVKGRVADEILEIHLGGLMVLPLSALCCYR